MFQYNNRNKIKVYVKAPLLWVTKWPQQVIKRRSSDKDGIVIKKKW